MEKKTIDYSKQGINVDAKYDGKIYNYLLDNSDEVELLKLFNNQMGIKIKPKQQTLHFFDDILTFDDLDETDEKPIEERVKEIKANKEKKLLLLSDIKDENLINLHDLMYNTDGELIGYTMEKVKGENSDPLYFSRRDKINYLSQIRDMMLRLNEKNIFIGDFNPKNFVVDENKKVICTNTDNFKVYGNDFDIKTIYMRDYKEDKGKEELIDRYCFNMLAISVLGKYVLGYFDVRNVNLPMRLWVKKHNRDAMEEMCRVDENYTGKVLEFEKKKKNN